jgi:hypothetical protein
MRDPVAPSEYGLSMNHTEALCMIYIYRQDNKVREGRDKYLTATTRDTNGGEFDMHRYTVKK